MEIRMDLNQFFSVLDALFQKNDKRAVQTYLENGLNRARAVGDDEGAIAIANELGGYYRVIGALEEAKSLYQEALFKLTNMGLKDSEHYATTLINAGDVYIYDDSYEEALKYFLEAKAILERRHMDGDYRMTALCNNISMAYRAMGLYESAEKALENALKIIGGVEACRSELATTYINLGALQVKQGKLTLAEESFLSACRIYEDDGGRDVHFSTAYAGLGEVYYLKGAYHQAKMYYRKALALIERDFGKTALYERVLRNIDQIEERVKDEGYGNL